MFRLFSNLKYPFVVAAFVFFVGYGADLILLRYPKWIGVDEFAMALVVGALVFGFEHLRNRVLGERLRVIRDMNRYVRNELQVLLAAANSGLGTTSAGEIERCVDHIDWALRELLPGKTTLGDEKPPLPFPARKIDRPA
jgi:hypothetical protein